MIVPRRRLILGLGALPAAGAAAEPLSAIDLPQPRRPGLTPLGGLVLDTSAWGFGGFSALHLGSDLRLTAVSDRGRWWQAPLRLEESGRPFVIGAARHGPLRDAGGAPLRGRAADAEALTRLPDGSWLIGFEREHRLRRHERLDGPGLPFPAPPGLADAPANAGIEGLAVLADGRLLALAEGLPGRAPNARMAWLGRPDGSSPRWEARDYLPESGLDPTDATGLPDGGALVLERDFTLFGGFRARLARVPREAFAGAGAIVGHTLLDLPWDGPAENWEGVAFAETRFGPLLALVSDDNERALQRSLLLLYRLD
jgi:hypothetical protein